MSCVSLIAYKTLDSPESSSPSVFRSFLLSLTDLFLSSTNFWLFLSILHQLRFITRRLQKSSKAYKSFRLKQRSHEKCVLILCLIFLSVSFFFSFFHGQVKGNSGIEIIMKTKQVIFFVMRLEPSRYAHKSKNQRLF